MTIKDFGSPLSINEIYNEFIQGKNIRSYSGQIWAKPSNGTSGTFASAGSPLSFRDFYSKARRKFINLYIGTNTQNYVLNSSVSGYIAGITTITLQVNSAVQLGSASTANPALSISGFTTGDAINVINNGYIVGAGGDGGDVRQAGSDGGDAMHISFATTITNNGTIGGGGGGGGGSGDEEAIGGGGGAGYTAGAAGSGGNYGATAGTLLTGGNGGTSPDGDGAGGAGGALGQPGAQSNDDPRYTEHPGGAAGYYLVGATNVSWGVTGTRLGNVS